MKTINLLFIGLFFSFGIQAQIKFLGEGRCEGTQITQADIDSLFITAPDITWIKIDYIDSTLTFPDFKKLDIFALRSEVLQTIVLPDTLLVLGLIDLNTPQLKNINEAITPNLFQLTLFANLPSIPMFVCNSEELTLVDIKNYRLIEWPECLDERFENGNFESSSFEIIDGFGGETIAKIVSPENTSDEWLESSDDMSDEELRDLQKGMQRTGRMITVIRRASGLALAGILFLIFKS